MFPRPAMHSAFKQITVSLPKLCFLSHKQHLGIAESTSLRHQQCRTSWIRRRRDCKDCKDSARQPPKDPCHPLTELPKGQSIDSP